MKFWNIVVTGTLLCSSVILRAGLAENPPPQKIKPVAQSTVLLRNLKILVNTQQQLFHALVEQYKQSQTTVNTAEQGMRVYIDPETGEFVSQPIEGVHEKRSITTIDRQEEFVEIRMPDGGYMLYREGGFNVQMKATLDAEGNVRITTDTDFNSASQQAIREEEGE